ncbi:alpha/beta hydrolase [Streptomyces avicenniae]|uniref:alpha/beta hydrolase n=1 Tax=Streptomyces avicenniae TaxID=500153 RepID=UPI00069A0B77|nr:alpha/beta hydrolase [Streptomyces avicenniae]
MAVAVPQLPSPRPEGDRLVYRDLTYAEIAGFRPLLLDLFVPTGVTGPVPLLVWIHGGAWLWGSHRVSESWLGDRPATDPVEAALAGGFAMATVQYRLSGEAVFPAQLEDVRAAVRWLRAAAPVVGVDPGRVGVWGESAGGHLAGMLALTAGRGPREGDAEADDERVGAAVLWYPPTDFVALDQHVPAAATGDPDSADSADSTVGTDSTASADRTDSADSPEARLLGVAVPLAPEVAFRASPVAHVSGEAPPMLLMHGDRDRTVPHRQSVDLAAALTAAGASCELLLVEGADHCFEGVDPAPLVEASVRFFAARL